MTVKRNYTAVLKAIIEKINAAGYDFNVSKTKYLSKKGYYYHFYNLHFMIQDLSSRYGTEIFSSNNPEIPTQEDPAPGTTANYCKFSFKMGTTSYGALKGEDLAAYLKSVTKAAELVNWLNENAEDVNAALRHISKSNEGEGFKILYKDKTNE